MDQAELHNIHRDFRGSTCIGLDLNSPQYPMTPFNNRIGTSSAFQTSQNTPAEPAPAEPQGTSPKKRDEQASSSHNPRSGRENLRRFAAIMTQPARQTPMAVHQRAPGLMLKVPGHADGRHAHGREPRPTEQEMPLWYPLKCLPKGNPALYAFRLQGVEGGGYGSGYIGRLPVCA